MFVTQSGTLTAAGYAAVAAAAVILFLISGIARKNSRFSLSAKQLVFCAAAMALAFLTSFIKLFALPYGGSVTLFSMLFICLIGNWYGVKVGLLTGLAYGILQFIQEPFVLSPFQVCCDYVFAFAALGLSGVFSGSKNGLTKGYILGVLGRGFFHCLGGYLYWMDYMPENFPRSLTVIYPIVYNFSFLLAEAVLTLIILQLPPVKNGLDQVRKLACEA